jgi:tetratricopeptide (TPR) repeat protein
MSRSAGKGAARVAVALWAPVMMWVVLSAIAPAPSFAAPDRRELQAREAFAAGRYQEALDLYAKLYAEKLHPNYLRNIGRCYQDLGEPDRAINSFRDYLRKAKVSADERKEVEGFISEMEELKKKQERDKQAAVPVAAAPPTEKPVAAAPPPPAPPPPALAPPPPAAAPAPAVAVTASGPESPAKDEPSPLYKKWWLWALVGAALAAGVGGAAAAGVFTKKDDAVCSMARECK